jgi:2-dehydro-3-deoxyphosphogluconate aldolase/(4S)-4-hydroxy-2-oxoglutarate aldolase
MTDETARVRNDPDWFTSGLASCPVMGVFRGLSPIATVALANDAWDIGVTQVEVPIESPSSLPSLVAAIAAGSDRGMRVGAGTIISAAQLRMAVEAGAAYVVSPGLDPSLIALADRAGMPVLPGVATASEILRAQSMGFTWLKAFPASVLGPGWFTAMKGPFPELNLVGTGGVNGHNAAELLSAGASVVGVGATLGETGQRERLMQIIEFRGVASSV